MSAKEMFERLGYELLAEGMYTEDNILHYICRKKNIEIIFYLKEKQFVKTKRVIDCVAIKESELKAIIQQCKELGWFEEQKQETNLDHYKDDIAELFIDKLAIVDGKPERCKHVTICDFCDLYEKCVKHKAQEELRKWLKQPYEKPAYKLNQFEYDLIKTFDRCKECCLLNEIECLKKLSEKGYFKGIDPFTKVHEIIDNCEVIQ